MATKVLFGYIILQKLITLLRYRDQLRMRVEDCSKDGRTCPECNYVSHTTSDLMYHVARVHDFVLDYLPPHVKEKVVALESRNKTGGGGGATEDGKKTKIVAVSNKMMHLGIFIVVTYSLDFVRLCYVWFAKDRDEESFLMRCMRGNHLIILPFGPLVI